MTIRSIEVRKKGGEEKSPKVVSFHKVFELSALKDGKDFHTVLQEKLHKPAVFWASKAKRYLEVDNYTCIPGKTQKETEGRGLSILLDDSVVMYTLLMSDDHDTCVGIIGTAKRTIFIIGRPAGGYFFTFDQSSVSAKEAATHLFINNLNKGVAVYNKTMSAAPGFFKGLFGCVVDDLTVQPFTIKHQSGAHVSTRLYLDPRNPDSNMISVCGMVYGLDLDEYPSTQISRGYYCRPKEE